MKKTFSILTFTFLFATEGLCQAQVDIPLDVTDGSFTIQMAVGLDTTATDCIDHHLGEADLPPVPPSGVFEARFDLTPYGCQASTYKDYRAPGDPPAFPFTGSKEHKLIWQLSFGSSGLTIHYNLPSGVWANLQDPFGGILYNISIIDTGSILVPYSDQLTSAILTMYYNNVGGDPGGPIFGISTLSLNFPQIAIGSDTSLPVTVNNFGTINTLSITNIVSSNNHFTITPNTFPINIPPLMSQEFQVTNTSDSIAQQGTFQFTHNAYGSTTNLDVSAPPGFQPGPAFEISTTSLIFRQRPTGQIDSHLVTIYNHGYLNTLYINNIVSSNSYFDVYPNSIPIAIEPLSYQDFYVRYTSADTLQQGIIEFIHNAPGSPTIINVSSVYSQTFCSIYPSSLLFGSQPGTADFWISNTGIFDNLVITSATSSNSNYNFNQNTFPITVVPGSTEIFYLTLSNASGFQFTVIKVYSNAPSSPHILYASNQPLTPCVEGKITISSGPMNQIMYFGLDTVATDGIDIILGENDIPPVPPVGVFDARYVLPENDSVRSLNSWNDYRYGFNPFEWHKEFRLSYQRAANQGIEISWDLPQNISGVLQDIINGSFINVPIADTGSFIVQDPETFNKLKMLIDFNGTTPVELISLSATLLNTNVKLDWTTASEINNSGFEILRFTQNDNEWNEIGFVPGFGTTTESKSYSFVDEDVTTGTYNYRLKQIDFDGTFEYSNEIEVVVDLTPKEFVLYQNYPNPFNPNTVIKFEIPGQARNDNALVTLKVFDVLGNEVATLINEEKQPGVYEVEFNTSHSGEVRNLTSGVYFYRLVTGSFSNTKKMILLR